MGWATKYTIVQLYGRCAPRRFALARGDEAVFAFSPNPNSHAIILQHYGNFADVYVATACYGAKKVVENLASENEEFFFGLLYM